MALIKCPECGTDVSNKAKSCIHCGYPIEKDLSVARTLQDNGVELALIFLDSGNEKAQCIKLIREITGWDLARSKSVCDSKDKNILLISKNEPKLNSIKEQLESIGATAQVRKLIEKNPFDQIMLEKFNQSESKFNKDNTAVNTTKSTSILVTTGDLKQDYDIIGPVYFQVSNKGVLSSTLSQLIKTHYQGINQMKADGTMSREKADWGFLYGEWSVGQNQFEQAFYVATQELKKRARRLGADAIICMRQDIDLDTNGFAHFYLQMYGTAVKLK